MTASSIRPLTRRDVLKTLTASATAFATRQAEARSHRNYREEIARGFVFEDSNGDGARTSQSSGVADIMVSNGRDVTLTAANGAWALPVRDGDSVFVIKPPNWSVGVTNTARRGYYLYEPDGTPKSLGLQTPGVAPSGALPASIDFALRRTPEPHRFDVLMVADTQAANAAELAYVRAELRHCMSRAMPQFAIHHGDVMGDDLTLFSDHLAMTRETGVPWYHCPGNHDMNLDSPSNTHAFDAWKQAMGPAHTALRYAGATFILLNNVEYFGRGSPHREGRGYRGSIGADQLQFVANVLRHVPEDDLIVVSMHIPLVSFDAPDSISDTTADRRALMQLLSSRKHTVSFAGHSHTTEHHYLGSADGFSGEVPHHHQVLTAACGSWWSGPADERGVPVSDSRDGTPKGVHILSIDGNRYTTRLLTSPSGQGAPLRAIVSDSSGAREAQLVVDVFDGGPKTRVSCSSAVFGASPVTLTRTTIEDPHIVETFAQHKALNKPWVAPAPSSHIWTLPLPGGLSDATLDVTLHVTGEFGDHYEVAMTLDVPARSGDAIALRT